MRRWFEQLEKRERLLVSGAAALVVFALVVTLGIRPLMSKTDRSREIVSDKKALLIELEQVAARLGPQTGSSQGGIVGAGQSLVVLVDQTIRTNGLSPFLKQNQPDGSTNIRVRFENIAFDTLTEWLAQLKSQYGMTTVSANINAAQNAGRVNCNLVLTRSGV